MADRVCFKTLTLVQSALDFFQLYLEVSGFFAGFFAHWQTSSKIPLNTFGSYTLTGPPNLTLTEKNVLHFQGVMLFLAMESRPGRPLFGSKK